MATCLEVITRALQKAGIGDAGESPDANEAANGLTALQSMYDQWVTGGMFGRLTDVYKSAAYTAKEFERVRKDAAVTITIPTTVEDPETGETRTPRDRAVIQVIYPATDARETHLYDAQLGEWVRIETLTLVSTAPLSSLGSDGLAACLAVDIADEYGGNITPLTVQRAAAFKHNLAGGFNSERTRAVGSYF